MSSTQHVDVLIVGAGISGIGAACHLTMKCPNHSFVILEGRDAIGGTWDLFRYPGIRSDSDMFTLGYSFRPWTKAHAIAEGQEIREYVEETARDYGVDKKIRYNTMARRITWSSKESIWTVHVESPEGPREWTCRFLFMCAGYYAYEEAYTPDFPGLNDFDGEFVHPQFWSDEIEYQNKNVVVIGSGATAVSLVPELAKKATHVTMLQRSPTYLAPYGRTDTVAEALAGKLSPEALFHLVRGKNILREVIRYWACRTFPELLTRHILDLVRAELDDKSLVEQHFTPSYKPWDQRICLVADGDLLHAVNRGDVSVVTDHIQHFTPTGIALKSGETLDADLVVSATGLQLRFLGGVTLEIDGEEIDLSKRLVYKGMMLAGVPNMAWCFGYTNASWTLKVDLTCDYVCRLLHLMDKKGAKACRPMSDPTVKPRSLLNLTSGYIERAKNVLPKDGDRRPWRLYQNYILDRATLKHGELEDGVLEFFH